MTTSSGDPTVTSLTRTDPDASTAVVLAVAEATGRSATDLPPLSDPIAPDALDRLFEDETGETEVTFRYAGFLVTVSGGGPFEVDLVERRPD